MKVCKVVGIWGESVGRPCTLTCEYTVTHGVGLGTEHSTSQLLGEHHLWMMGSKENKKIEKEELMPSAHQKCSLHLIFRDPDRKDLKCRLKREVVKRTLCI